MKKMLMIGLSLGALGSAAMAQTPGGQQQSVPVAGQVQLGVDVRTLDWVAVGYRASQLLKANVYNEQDKKIGDIADLIIKPDGSVNVAIVEVGGFLGMGKHHVAIPVKQFSSVSPKIVLPGATKESLKSLPEFKYSK
jgi:sporulation protein YlmC with PRC-barrel domain